MILIQVKALVIHKGLVLNSNLMKLKIRIPVYAQILIAIVLGILAGVFLKDYVHYSKFLGDIFFLGLKMLVAPLILASIVMGVAGTGNIKRLGKLGAKTIIYYLATTIIAIFLGILLTNLIRPGDMKLEGYSNMIGELRAAAAKAGPLDATAKAALTAILADQGREKTPRYHRDTARQLLAELDKAGHATRSAYSSALLKRVKTRKMALKFKTESFFARVDQERGAHKAKSSKEQIRKLKEKPMTMGEALENLLHKALSNPFAALANLNVMAIIVFALLLGGVLSVLGDRGKPLLKVFDSLNLAMMKMVHIVMLIAPLGVFALMANEIASSGLSVLLVLLKYMATVIIGLSIHAVIILPAILWVLGRMNPLVYFRGIREALAIAFSTSSSSATLPVTMRCLNRNLDVPEQVTGFVVPLGATINMDGTALYEAVAAIFIAQLYGIDLSFGAQATIFLTATAASIGAAGIPSAGTVTMVMVFTAVGLPLEGIGLILAVDRILDMFRTTVNVWGDGTGAVVIARMEGWRHEAPKKEPAES